MESNIHKGSGLNNVSETWDRNERKRENDSNPGREERVTGDTPAANDLERAIKREAADYDKDDKEDRILGGERASVNDEASDQ